MLKVVGASSVQTRVTLFTLAAVVMFGILTYYYGGVTTPSHDGNYAATVFWSRTAGYRLQFWGQNNDPDTVRQGVARAYYRPDMTYDGWASMEIETSEVYPDRVQAHAAGLLEGSLSWQLIYYHWKNTVERACDDRQHFCDQARIILDQNTINIRQRARALDLVDPFWHQVNMFYEQLDGLEVGWRYAVQRSRKDFDIPHQDFLWMNIACDLRDLELMYNASIETNPNRPSLSMALLKLVPNDSSQFLLAHASSSFYSAMLRVQKRYHFGLHMTGASGSALVPGQVITFTSYPGTVHSQDDFYKVTDSDTDSDSDSESTGLTVAGTTIKNINDTLWADAQVTSQVFMGPRVMAANRVARDPRDWARLATTSYSGTGNKQWLVVQAGGRGVELWVVEQLPGLSHAETQSDTLRDTGYWASYGLPHYKDILNASGNAKWLTNITNPVAYVLSTGQTNVTDLDSLISLMRSPDLTIVGRSDLTLGDLRQLQLDYQDRFLRSTTESDQSNEISYTDQERDLNDHAGPPHFVRNIHQVLQTMAGERRLSDELKEMEENTLPSSSSDENTDPEYQTDKDLPEIDLLLSKRRVFNSDDRKIMPLREFSGVIDLKVSQEDSFVAAAGPPFSVSHTGVVVEPFQWSKSPIKDLPHVGQADIWDFQPVKPKWVWN